jgi:hypothetical protein
MLLDLRVSADRAAWPPPHTGGKPGLFQQPRRNPERDGLSAGGRWIRTIDPAVKKRPREGDANPFDSPREEAGFKRLIALRGLVPIAASK